MINMIDVYVHKMSLEKDHILKPDWCLYAQVLA